MNKAELVAALADKTNVTKRAAEDSINSLVEIVENEVKKGGKVQLVGLKPSNRC